MLPLFVPSAIAHSFSPISFYTLLWPLSQLHAFVFGGQHLSFQDVLDTSSVQQFSVACSGSDAGR